MIAPPPLFPPGPNTPTYLLRHLLALWDHPERDVLLGQVRQLEPRGTPLPDHQKLDGVAAVHQEGDAEGVLPRVPGCEVQGYVEGLPSLEDGGLARSPEAPVSLVQTVQA